MLADGLTKVLPLQCDICALTASKTYAIPTGGRTGRLGALTLLASKVVLAGGTSVAVRGEQVPADTGLGPFINMVLMSYLIVFVMGVLAAMCVSRKIGKVTQRTHEVMVTDTTRQTPQTERRSRTTAKTTEARIADCCAQQHNTRAGRNASSVFITCFECEHHCSWLKTGEPTFMLPELALQPDLLGRLARFRRSCSRQHEQR